MNKMSLLALIVALCALGLSYFQSPAHQAAKQESAYEHVMRTGILRCGYVIDPPHVIKDPNNGQISGVIPDLINEAGKLLQIKIDWAEEVGWGNTVEALRSHRVDAICTDYWMEPLEGRYVGYTMPLYFAGLAPYVRTNDTRFDKEFSKINDPAITIATTDGDVTNYIAQMSFPKSKIFSMPNMTDVSTNLLNVMTGKADIAFADIAVARRFEKNNPGALKRLMPDQPFMVFPATIALPQGDVALKTMLDSALTQLLYSGFTDRTLDHYNVPDNVTYRTAHPYRQSEQKREIPQESH